MEIGMFVKIPGGTQEQYDKVMENLKQFPPDGLVSHVAGPVDGGWIVVDVWKSQEDWDKFRTEQLMSAIQAGGMPMQDASFTSFKVHNRA